MAQPERARAAPSPWAWVPSLYLTEGLPYVVAQGITSVMYTRLGVGVAEMAYYTSWLYLPWVLKPLWSPLVDALGKKRTWVTVMQAALAVLLLVTGASLTLPAFLLPSVAALWLLALASATHDIAADGFYLLALETHQQAAFVGVRSAFYRLAMVAGSGGLVVMAGYLEESTGQRGLAWGITLGVVGVTLALLTAWHARVLPRPDEDRPQQLPQQGVLGAFLESFRTFFARPGVGRILAFLLLYRLGEAQLLKLVSPFLLDTREHGGLALSTKEVGLVYGTFGTLALTVGGLLGGFVISQRGLRALLWPMVLAIHLPDAVFVFLSMAQPENTVLIGLAVVAEQFGYGFGFTAYAMVMVMVSQGPHKTSHYALCTGFMALGMMLPGMAAGALQAAWGYQNFFLWVLLCTIPGFVVAGLIPVQGDFGRKQPE